MSGTSVGMGRGNNRVSVSPNAPQKFQTPEKVRGSNKLYSTKKKKEFDARDHMVAECSLRDI